MTEILSDYFLHKTLPIQQPPGFVTMRLGGWCTAIEQSDGTKLGAESYYVTSCVSCALDCTVPSLQGLDIQTGLAKQPDVTS